MKAATDNAEELKTKLTRIMNRARQDSITTEIMEIVGGAEALKGDDQGGDPEELLLLSTSSPDLDPTDPRPRCTSSHTAPRADALPIVRPLSQEHRMTSTGH